MQELDTNKIKKELQKVLEEKENNLVRIYFDSYYIGLRLPELEDNFKIAHNNVVQIDGELSVAKVPIRKNRNNEKIVKLQTKLQELQKKEKEIEIELDKTKEKKKQAVQWVKESLTLIDAIKQCIKDTKLIIPKK